MRIYPRILVALFLLMCGCSTTVPKTENNINDGGVTTEKSPSETTSEKESVKTEKENATTGTVVLKFSISEGVRESPNLTDPPKGAIYGSIFKSEDVNLSGPAKGAKTFGSIELADVDLTKDKESKGFWKSGPIPPGTYTFLGFYDIDGNGTKSKKPDAGDPVTLPNINKFTITAGQKTKLTVRFDLVFN